MEGLAKAGRRQSMRFRKPPSLATRLLLVFRRHPDNEAILGDLHERYQTRQSSIWYWRQTFIAIFNGLIRRTRGHKLESARALVVGWSALGAIWFALEGLSGQPFPWSRHACTFFWCIAGTGSGSVVRLLAKQRKRPMIFLYAASVAVFLILLHPAPQSRAIVYWIDTVALTISISLAAVPLALPAQQSIVPTEENAS
jgi:hypothetical protein